jgi:Flp pilus assembly protein TadD
LKLSHFNAPLGLLLSITIGLSFSLLTGCSSLTNGANPGTANSSSAKDATQQADADTEGTPFSADQETYPDIPLTSDIFFQVTIAEVAYQRGDFLAAYSTYMALGQQTRDPRFPKRALQMALVAKQATQAYLASRYWFNYAPKSDEALQYYVGFLIVNNNLNEVKSILQSRLADANPKERGILILQSERLIMRSPNKDNAFNVLEELCQPYPDYIESHMALAQAAFINNNGVRAMLEARAAQKIDPKSEIAIQIVSQVSPSPEESLKVLAQYLSEYPDANEVRRAYAGMLIEQKQYAQARSQFDTLLANKPDDAAILYNQGILSLQLNDLPAAEKNLSAFVALADNAQSDQRDPTTAYLYLAQIADDKKDGVAALAWLAKIQSYDGKNAAWFNAQLRRAILMAKYGTLDEARDFLNSLPTTSSEEKIQIIQLDAELLRNADRDQEAITILQNALKDNPDNQDLLYDYAMMAEKFDRVDDMEKALRHVIELNPKNQQAYNALGYSLADRNIRLPEARVLIEKALELAPDDAFIIDSMGWLEFRENKVESALTYLQRAYSIRPDADIAVHVGEVLWTMGDQKKAIAMWKEAQQKDPKNAALKSTLERLKVNL